MNLYLFSTIALCLAAVASPGPEADPIALAEKSYRWMTPDEFAKTDPRVDRHVTMPSGGLELVFDNVSLTRTVVIDKQPYKVLKLTSWQTRKAKWPPRDPASAYEVITFQYRILRLAHPDVDARGKSEEKDIRNKRPDPGYLLQYRTAFQNRLSKAIKFEFTVTLRSRDDKTTAWTDTFSTEGHYFGPMYGHMRLSAAQLSSTIAQADLTVGSKQLDAERKKVEERRKKHPFY